MEEEILGIGSQLWLTSGAGVLTKVAGLLNVNRPNLSVDSVETTDHDSANGVREYMPGLGDPGELSGKIKYVPGSPTDDLILEHLASRKKRAMKIVTPNGPNSSEDHSGTIFMMSYEPDDAPVEGVRTATFTAKVSGAIAQAATAAVV